MIVSTVVIVIIMVVVMTFAVIVLIVVVVVVFFHQEGQLGGDEHILEWQFVSLGDLDAVFVLGGKDDRLVGTPRQLSFDRTEVGLNGVRRPLTDRAFDHLAANAERVGFIENDRLHFGGIFVLADHAEDHTGAVLLHLDRGRVDIERSGGEEQSLGVAEDFAGRGVEVRFEQHHAVGAARRDTRLADKQPHDVRAIFEVHRPRAVADRLDRHLGESFGELIDHDLDDGRAGGSRQFGFDGDIDKWDSLEQFGGTGRGDRADSVRDFHSAMTGRDRAANDFIDAEQREADRGGGDIDDGVNRADLVKVNLFDRRTVDGRFGFGDGGEDAERQIALIVSQDFRTVDDLLNVGQMAVRVLFRMLHTQMLRAKAAAHHVLKMQRDAGEAERVDSRLDRRHVNARVDERRHGHVTADSRGTVQIRDSHEFILWSKPFGREAICATSGSSPSPSRGGNIAVKGETHNRHNGDRKSLAAVPRAISAGAETVHLTV